MKFAVHTSVAGIGIAVKNGTFAVTVAATPSAVACAANAVTPAATASAPAATAAAALSTDPAINPSISLCKCPLSAFIPCEPCES